MILAYWNNLSVFDWGIIIYGILLFLGHIVLFFAHCTSDKIWANQGIKVRQEILLMLSELLPLLGLLGTVLALLYTFQGIETVSDGNIDIGQIIRNFAPALTTTASGIICLIPNLLLNALLWWSVPDECKQGV